jgi:hypothetical protein
VAVTTDDRAVVWVESSAVYLCPVGGCTSTKQISAGSFPFGNPVVGGVAMDSSYVYWLDGNSSVLDCPLAGCLNANSVYPADAQFGFHQIAVSSSGVFLSDGGTIIQCQNGSCNSTNKTTIVSALDSPSVPFALDTNGVFFVLSGEAHGVFYCALGSCPPSFQTPLFNAYGSIAAANGIAYVASGTSILSCPATGCSTIPTTVTNNAGSISSLAADATAVYWTTKNATTPSAGTMQMCLLPDCPGGPMVLAPNQNNPVSIVVSAHYVVWANQGSSGTGAAIMGWVK